MEFVVPGGDLPEWFCHLTTESSICFQGPSHSFVKFEGFVDGCVLRPEAGVSPDFEFEYVLSCKTLRVCKAQR